MQEKQFTQLLEKFLQDNLTPEELNTFLSGAKLDKNQDLLQKALDDKLKNKVCYDLQDKVNMEQMFQNMLAKAAKEREATAVISIRPANKYIRLFRIAAAAIIFIAACTGALYFFGDKTKTDIAGTKPEQQLNNDVHPGGNKAILTLANGTNIILDSANDGTISQQGNTKIVKLNAGQLAYKADGKENNEVVYNTISTPRGGTYQVILPDETKVWLNASSSLRFPTVFTGKERAVEISGEAYFEVTKNKLMPFKVSVNDMEIQVLGTHFNVMAYNDEQTIKTTLLEGAVKVNKADKTVFLNPGQQAKLTNENTDLKVINDVDTDEVVAWKNGRFQFNADLSTVMRQLSRWYNVEVSYTGSIPSDHFTGKISRNISLSKVLKILELSDVHFKIEGGKIIVIS
jgi:transmembrane sensor